MFVVDINSAHYDPVIIVNIDLLVNGDGHILERGLDRASLEAYGYLYNHGLFAHHLPV